MIRYIIPLVTFILGAVLSPILEVTAVKMLNRYGPFAERVYFDACLPLRQSLFIVRDAKTKEPLLTFPMEMLNETSFLIRNELGRSLSNVTITATPITGTTTQPTILQADIVTNALAASRGYAVSKSGSAIQVDIPTWGNGDTLLANIKLDRPVAYVLEIYAGSESYREIFEPGCAEGSYTLSPPPSLIFVYSTPSCDASAANEDGSYECNVESSPIDIPSEIREGREITAEFLVVSDSPY